MNWSHQPSILQDLVTSPALNELPGLWENVFAHVSGIKYTIPSLTQRITPFLDSIKRLVFTLQGNRTVVILPTKNTYFIHIKFAPCCLSAHKLTLCLKTKSHSAVLFKTLITAIKLKPCGSNRVYNSTEVKTIWTAMTKFPVRTTPSWSPSSG